MHGEISLGRSRGRLSAEWRERKMRGMTKQFCSFAISYKSRYVCQQGAEKSHWHMKYRLFREKKKLACKQRAAFLFKNVTSEAISQKIQKQTILHKCQIKTFCVVIYWSLTFIYWTRHSSWTTGPSNRTRGKTGNLSLKCADILRPLINNFNEIKHKYSTVSRQHMTTLSVPYAFVYQSLANADTPVSLKTKAAFVLGEFFPK